MGKQAEKKNGKGDKQDKALRKLARAQLALEVAREKHAQARVRGKQEIEQARLRAAEWETKTAEQLERAAAKLSRAEARLLKQSAPEIPDSAARTMTVASPETTAEVLEHIETGTLLDARESPIVLPEATDHVTEPEVRNPVD